jgi:hypothetical protein
MTNGQKETRTFSTMTDDLLRLRDWLVDAKCDALNANQMNRGQVLRDIVESSAVGDRFFNRAFVTMQYFGYLHRDPDLSGFQNWVNTLNADPSNFRHMIFGFLFSAEYRQRFGP